MKLAACNGKAPNRRVNPAAKDLWFPEQGQSPNPGKLVCAVCPVKIECREYKERTGSDHGMWAGKIDGRDKPDQ